MEENELTLMDVLKVIKRYFVFILILTIVGGGIGYILSDILPKKYEAYTTIVVGSPDQYTAQNQFSVESINFNQKLVATYGEIIRSKKIAEATMRITGKEERYQDFFKKVKVELIQDTEIIRVTVKENNPENARDTANAIATAFSDHVRNVMKIDNVQVLDLASTPDKYVFPAKGLFIQIGIVLGFIIGIILSFMQVLTDTRIKSAEYIEEELGVPVIGKIPSVKKKRKRS